MKQLFISLFTIISLLSCCALKAFEPGNGVIIFYKVQEIGDNEYDITLNNIRVGTIYKMTRIVHEVFSEGKMVLVAKDIQWWGSREIKIDIKKGDTIYVKFETGPITSGRRINIMLTTREEYMADIKGYKFESDLKTQENPATPYISANQNKTATTKNPDGMKTGAGFLISPEGYIVTNYHIVENSKDIAVKGINGNQKSAFSASIILKDETNDLVILKLDDRITLNPVPYTLKKEVSDIGESVYIPGYSNTSDGGIMMSNGIINAKSGYEGNINSYRLSTTIQSSGCPVFDSKGNIIAVANSKYAATDNSGYAVKAKYLFELLDGADKKLNINETNKLAGKSLAEQIKDISDFVYTVTAK